MVSKRITKASIRQYAFQLRIEGMDSCMKAAGIVQLNEPRKWASLRERGELLRRIANELDALMDGELT
jgi:hypothetical protein